MKRLLVAASFLFAATLLHAAPYDEMDYGPFVSHTFQMPNNNITPRGIAVPFDAPIEGEKAEPQPPAKGKKPAPLVNNPAKCGIIFDTELLRYSGYWSGGFITWNGVVFNGSHGANPGPAGKVLLATKQLPGFGKEGKFDDPRPIPHGPMPREWGRYKGLYRTDKGVIFSYTVGDTNVLDMPSVEVHGKHRFLIRTLNTSNGKGPIDVVIADHHVPKNPRTKLISPMMWGTNRGNGAAHVDQDGNAMLVYCRNPIRFTDDARFVVGVDRFDKVKIIMWAGPAAELEKAKKAIIPERKDTDLAPLIKGGKARFTETVTTQGKRGEDKGAYAVDSLTPPFKNPYKSWMRFGGFDFFSDGRAAVSTWSGDVWIVSGIDDGLQNLKWKRYAAGLFHALGLKIVDDKVYVLGRDQITRLHDLNGDGEADFYECFNNDAMITTNFHEFTFDLQTDPQGNFYFIKGGPGRPGGRGWDKVTPHHGCVFKVSKDGSKLEVVARGFRAPNGMGVGPHGEITTG
ncbi:MAG: hypothetical protein HYR84_10835, partial [Planctomycetes bacterium]|nr:hypothetical protein [Planctomycetota bacterium]